MKVYNGDVTIDQDEDVTIKVGNFDLVIKHNDVGVSIDLYDKRITLDEQEPLEEIQWWFDDYSTEQP